MEKEKTCSFFGHRKIEVTDKLVIRLKEIVVELIIERRTDTFLFFLVVGIVFIVKV